MPVGGRRVEKGGLGCQGGFPLKCHAGMLLISVKVSVLWMEGVVLAGFGRNGKSFLVGFLFQFDEEVKAFTNTFG